METKRCANLVAGAGALIGISVLAGCQDPLAAEATAARIQQIQNVADLYAQREADAPRRVRQTLDWADEIEQRHAERTIQNRKNIEAWLPDEWLRWQENQPMYKRRIAQQLAGNFESAGRAFRAMFY